MQHERVFASDHLGIDLELLRTIWHLLAGFQQLVGSQAQTVGVRHVEMAMNFAELPVLVAEVAAVAKHADFVPVEGPTVLCLELGGTICLREVVSDELIDVVSEPTFIEAAVPVG